MEDKNKYQSTWSSIENKRSKDHTAQLSNNSNNSEQISLMESYIKCLDNVVE